MEMNGSSQSSASASGPSGPTTPQQVAAAAAALAASRAASVSAAMRSVFGAKQQAALASAMMNASVNAAASKAAAAAVARAVPPPQPQPQPQPAALKTTPARATPTARPAAAVATASATGSASGVATTSVVVMQSSFDGLPALPPHVASCALDDATARIPSLACHAHDVPRDGAVDLYGEPSTRASIRAALLDHYAATNQLTTSKEPSGSSDAGSAISEMTLRMDTELEMLRRQCFAERNARWHFATPDEFAPAPAPAAREPVWVASPYVGPRRQTLLLRKYHEHQRLHASDKPHGVGLSSDPVLADHEALLQALVGVESVRDRAWPPKEFVAKSTTKPSRGGSGANALQNAANRTSSGKKKPVGMVGVVDETPVTARVCSECHTQSSALWRKRPRVPAATSAVPAMTVGAVAVMEEDVCLPCYLKTQRRDLFDRKAAEKARRIKEEAARAAAEARALKKQQQQMQKKIKKLQQLQQQNQHPEDSDALDVKTEDVEGTLVDGIKDEEDDDDVLIRPIKLTRRESMTATSALSGSYDVVSSVDHEQAMAFATAEDKKKREKKSKKDKKKKKKKKKKKASSDGWDDSDSDDDGAASSVIMPSPPQRQMDGFVYADRTADPVDSAAGYDHHEDGDAQSTADSISTEPSVADVVKSEPKSKKRGAAATTTASRSATSKKRKSTDSLADAPLAVPPTPTEKGRGSRARSSSASSAAVAVPVPVAPTTPSARKRARPTKKESARERELRALGQYCPVCNMTYEEDDASPFVCCDSCEMWVHAACDTSLSPETLATLADSSEKYICPLCGGR